MIKNNVPKSYYMGSHFVRKYDLKTQLIWMFLSCTENLKHLESPMSHPAGQVGSQLEEADGGMEVGGLVQGRSAKWDTLWWVTDRDAMRHSGVETGNLPQQWAPKHLWDCICPLKTTQPQTKNVFQRIPKEADYYLYITVFEPHLTQ